MDPMEPPKRRLISSGSTFEKEIGYSRAVVDGDWLFVSGTTGFDYSTMTIEEDIVSQTKQCLANIRSAVEKAGFRMEHIVRVRYFVPNAEEFPLCWPLLRQCFGEIRPASTMISTALADSRLKIEIEVTGKQ